jgi:ankyrin repeat protein
VSSGNWKELFTAACEGDLELVRYHVDHGVDVNYIHPEYFGTTLVACILAKQEEVALYLLQSGADPHLRSEFEGLTPIQAAKQAGLRAVEQKLIALGAEPPKSKWRLPFSG